MEFTFSWSDTAEMGKWIELDKKVRISKSQTPVKKQISGYQGGTISARYIRFNVTKPENENVCVTFELNGCEDKCLSLTCPTGSECTVDVDGRENCEQCIPGYLKRMNECVAPYPCQERSICGANATCVSNAPFDYACLCKKGFMGDSKTGCQECGPGYQDNGHGCLDVDECETGNHTCRPDEDCINTDGSHICQCKRGFRQKSNGRGCIDINECTLAAVSQGICPSDKTKCVNREGYFECTCNEEGYVWYGQECSDIDECKANLHKCENADCENTQGGYKCSCKTGYKFKASDPSQRQCVDVDECEEEDYRKLCEVKEAHCKNAIGSYKCLCAAGYSMSKEMRKCVDRDECVEDWPCSEFAFCRNEKGGYRCTCKPGYAGDGKECVKDLASTQGAQTKTYAIFAGSGGGALLLVIAVITFAYVCRKKSTGIQEGMVVTGFEPGFDQGYDPGFGLAGPQEGAEGDWTFAGEDDYYGSSDDDSDDSDVGTVFQANYGAATIGEHDYQ